MQIHPDALTFAFQRFCQLQRPQSQTFLARPRRRFDDSRPLCLFGGTQGEEVWRKQISNITGVQHVFCVIGPGALQRGAESADHLAMNHHRHMNSGAQAVIVDRLVKSARELKARVGAGIFGQDMVNLALQKRPDRAVGNRCMRLIAPVGFNSAFIGRMKLPILA